ncbi:MAG TPA: cytochrome c biogenesis protein CcsA [Actinomycetota bacterium]|nr:cytochrome c biogenesis protein CcsA [Actinomycetota bacterium]
MNVKTDALRRPIELVRRAPLARVTSRRRLWGSLTLLGLLVLLTMAFWYAPEDANQGAAQRIFYIHVPSAWIGFLAFLVVFVASIRLLATGERKWDDLASSSAEVGVIFTTGVLVTGPLWGRPVWGVYWTWDPRLTSFLMLWLIYLSYLVLRGYVPEPARRARFSAVLGIVGFLDVPIVYLSARWWRSEHPTQFVVEGGDLPTRMLVTLIVGVVTFTFLYLYLLSVRRSVGRLRARAEEAEVAR